MCPALVVHVIATHGPHRCDMRASRRSLGAGYTGVGATRSSTELSDRQGAHRMTIARLDADTSAPSWRSSGGGRKAAVRAEPRRINPHSEVACDAAPPPNPVEICRIPKSPRAPETLSLRSPLLSNTFSAEVRTGFEPAYNGFANRCLTAWLPHLAWKARGPCHEPTARSMVAIVRAVLLLAEPRKRNSLRFQRGA